MLSRFAQAVVIAIAIASVTVMTARTRVDVDLWGHIRFGLDILDSGALHEVDPYSFTSDRPWINHEWLSEIIIALAWRTAGTPGLIVVKLACALAAIGLIASALKQKRVPGHPRIVFLGLTLLGVLPRIAQVRPQLFSVVLFAGLVRVFVSSDQGSPRALIWSIPLLCLWANLHGGWLVGVATVFLWCAGEAYAFRSAPRRAAYAIACAMAAGAATLLNPYGAGLWTFLLETVGFGREAIREWGPAWTDKATMIVWSVFGLLTTVALRRALRSPWPRNQATLLIPIVWGIAALRVGRLDAFFAMSVVGFYAGHLSRMFAAPVNDRDILPRVWLYRTAALALILVMAFPPARRAFTCIDFLAPRWPEPQAVGFIQEHALSGRIITYFDWGEYAIWHLPRSLKVSLDGRRETVYSNRVIDGHLQAYAGTDEGLEFIRGLNPDYAWLPVNVPLASRLPEEGWIPVFTGPHSVILAPPQVAARIPVKVIGAWSDQLLRCFPGP